MGSLKKEKRSKQRKVKTSKLQQQRGIFCSLIEKRLHGMQETVLADKQVAYFVVCASMQEDTEEARQVVTEHYIDPMLEKYSMIEPAAEAGLFPGQLDFEKLYPVDYLLMTLMGFEGGDWRNMDSVGIWAEDLAEEL